MNRILTTPVSLIRQRLRFRQRLHEQSHHILLWRRRQILDPTGAIVTLWHHIFLFTSLVSLFVDPLYFYIPYVKNNACMTTDVALGVMVTLLRTLGDLFYIFHIFVKFRTAFIAPSSRVFGKGELVMDRHQIAIRYLKSSFIVDLAAALPLPQFVTYVVIPASKTSRADYDNNTLVLIVLLQYIPRLFLIFPLNKKIVKTTGLVARTAWAGAAYNLLLYLLASHILGAAWYILSIGRQISCWKEACDNEQNQVASCIYNYLDCRSENEPARDAWFKGSKIITLCDAMGNDTEFKFGIYAPAFTTKVAASKFSSKYFYCLWWGLRNLVSFAQNLETSTFLGETLYALFISITGLVLFAGLIGQMQKYLQSMTKRLEEWRVSKRDTEEWMRHRQLPLELRKRIRRFVQYMWLATRGVNEDSILHSLPIDLRREIQRHLCLQLVRRVPFFSQMDDQLLDAICERLVSSLRIKGTYVVREDDPVDEMLFIIRGQLESSTTDGGRSGFFNCITLRPGDFCGEELLTWALMPNLSLNLPSSTRTVRTLTEVEAFALHAEDLKFVAHRFKRLHSKKLQDAFRYYSHQWRTWGACFIQTAWRRYSKKKLVKQLALQESLYYSGSGYHNNFDDKDYYDDDETPEDMQPILKGQVADPSPSLKMPKLLKPDEPDFSAIEDDV